MNVCIRERAAPFNASPARSISSGRHRARAAMTGRRTLAATCFTPSASSADAIGKPASIKSTPSPSSSLASCTFSLVRSENPGACSPSRSVVSKIVIRSVVMSFVCTAQRHVRQIYINEFVIRLVYMELAELRVFLTVATERSFSRAATKLHRTQPAVSQAIRRLEDEVGERLFDRSSKDGTLTEAGRVLRDYAERLQRLAEEAQLSVRELRELQRGRVLIGSNEGGVHMLLP